MNEDIINDLKQFIAGQIHQQSSDIRGDISNIRGDIGDIRSDIKRLDEKIDAVDVRLSEKIEDVDLKIDTILEHIGTQTEENNKDTANRFNNHEARITKLEARPA